MKRSFFLLLLSSMAWGQGAFIPPQQTLKIVNGITSPVPLATVTVCAAGASGIPCAPALVGAIFKDAALTQPLPNPFTSDAFGNYQFAIAPGTYTVTTTALGFVGNSFQITVASGSGGGGGTPGGSNTQVQFNNSGTFGGIGITAGQALVGSTGAPIAQVKPLFDVRDSASSFDCTGTNAMDTGMQSISSTAHIIVPFGCIIKLTSAHTYPQTFEFKQGGQLQPNTGILITLTGPIIAGSYKIFSNATTGQGGIDLTGNLNGFDVLPEWWGAGNTTPVATNTAAIQSAIYASFGCATSPATVCRTNSQGTSFYNKPLKLSTSYGINGELKLYHVLNFLVDCRGRLWAGITQTASNQRIFDGQSDAYGAFYNCIWSSNTTQDLSHPLIDLNFDGSQGNDLRPQFIDFQHNTWTGNQTVKIGMRLSAAGGGAQGSNINFYDNFASGFTEAAYMVGTGSGCSPTNIATNAVDLNWIGGDMQNNFGYGIESFGGTQMVIENMTSENGGNIANGGTHQTGADFCLANIPQATSGNVIRDVRTEDINLLTNTNNASGIYLQNVATLDTAVVAVPGNSGFLGDTAQGNTPCNHGLMFDITVAGTWGGLGSIGSPRTASSGTLTTIVDSVGGLTVNAWTGWQVCVLGGTGFPEYCLITSNTATTFTCTAGFKSDFRNAPVAPDGTTQFDIEPNWGTQTTSGTVTFALDTYTYFGVSNAQGSLIFGRRCPGCIGAQLTRPDWRGAIGVQPFDDDTVIPADWGVTIMAPFTAGQGVAGGGGVGFIRGSTLLRNGVTEVQFFARREMGTRAMHWFSGQFGGGQSVSDVYLGTDSPEPGSPSQQPIFNGDLFILNNSNNLQKKWTFNFDGSLTVPTSNGTAATAGTGFYSTASNNLSFAVASGNPLQLSTNDVNISQRNLSFIVNKGQHLNTQASGNDLAGTCTAAAAATCTVTFTTAYASAPSCTVTDQTNITTLKALPSTTTLVITTAAASSDVFSYICIGNPN